MPILQRNKKNAVPFTVNKNGHKSFVTPNAPPKKRSGAVDIETIGRRATIVAYAFMLGAIGAIFSLSWDGLTNFGKDVLGLDGWMVHIVPGSLDGAVIMFGCMAIVSMVAGENASGLRALVQICAVGSAVFNGYQGWENASGNNRWFAGTYYAALSLLVAMISHWFFRRVKRAARIQEGTLSVETVHFSITEWMKFPIRRWKARTLALEYGITEPRLAITLEAAKNQRIDPRVMRALEAYGTDDTTRVYEFFPMDDGPEPGKGARKRRRKGAELPRNAGAESPGIQTAEGKPELSPGTMGTETAVSGSDGRWEGAGTDGPEDVPDGPETAVQAGCVGSGEPCACGHRNVVGSAGSQSEAVHYARSITGMTSGTDLEKWLKNHGRKVATSTVYEALKSYSGPAGIVPFRAAR